jgi:hypothetical protein
VSEGKKGVVQAFGATLEKFSFGIRGHSITEYLSRSLWSPGIDCHMIFPSMAPVNGR